RLNQITDRRQRVEQEVRIDLAAERSQLRFGGKAADFLHADLAVRAFARQTDRIDPATELRSDRLERGEVVRQEATTADELPDLERVPRRFGHRYVDRRHRFRSAAVCFEAFRGA